MNRNMVMLTFTFTEAQLGNLIALVTAGAKSPNTDHLAVIVGGDLLRLLDEQVQAQRNPQPEPTGKVAKAEDKSTAESETEE